MIFVREFNLIEIRSKVSVAVYGRNKYAMRTKFAEISKEIKRKTAAIRARFANPQARMFPVAVTFLVPEKMAGGK